MAVSPGSSGSALKVPPHNLEAEIAVLGGILVYPDSLSDVSSLLSDDGGDFYTEAHRIIYRRMLELEAKSEPIDVVTLGNLLERKGELQKIGGVETVANIINAVSTSAGIVSYANIVRDLSIRRQLLFKCSEIAEECFSGADDTKSLLDKTEQSIFSIRDQQKSNQLISLDDAIHGVFTQLTSTVGDGGLTGMPTGFTDIDRLTLGMQPSDLLILAARPSVGKTALGLNIAYNAVKETIKRGQPKAALIFSLEMSNAALAARLLALDSEVTGLKLRGGYLGAKDMEKLTDAASRLSEMPIFIDDSTGVKPLDIKAKCRRISKENKLGLVVIDYLQLMEGSRRSDSREQEIASISRTLKGLAKEMNIPVLALSQLNRKSEEQNRRPQLSDLRESGAIEQDADVIMFIHRERNQESEDIPRDITEVIIAKQRNGPTGTVKLLFQKDISRFRSLAAGYEP